MSMLYRGLGRMILFLAFGATCARLWAQPPLTTIRDTVYRADGKPFNGLVLIEWKAFQTSNNVNIGTQGTTVRVVNGSLYVRLAPTTSAANAYYLVRYNSDGQFQFSEVWSVPPSSAALRLRDIRGTLLPGGILIGGGAGGVVAGETGTILPNFGDAQTPAGAINGSNTFFVLPASPSPAASLALFRNGLLQTAGNDYTLNGATITFNSNAIPQLGDILEAYYRTECTNAASTHSLLSTLHGDSTPSSPARGGLIVAQGQPPAWTQLPVGQAGRCLTSNGFEVQWGSCAYSGLTAGSVPFVDANGALAQNPSSLVYNNLSRKFSVGNSTPRATLNVHDSSATGITELIVRAGSGQIAVPLQSWINAAGSSLAFVNADGGFNVQRLITNSGPTRAGIRDAGSPTDPVNSSLIDGDSWYNSAARGRKTYDAGQAHSTPQIICSNVGATTSATAFTDLGTCSLPAGLLFPGDRLQIDATFMHGGGSSAVELDVLAGGLTLAGRAIPAGDDVVSLEINLGLGSDAAAWSARTIGVSSLVQSSVGQGTFNPTNSFGPLRLRARHVTAGFDTTRLLNFTVRRIPQQSNP